MHMVFNVDMQKGIWIGSSSRRGRSRVVYPGVNALVIFGSSTEMDENVWGLLMERRWNENQVQRTGEMMEIEWLHI